MKNNPRNERNPYPVGTKVTILRGQHKGLTGTVVPEPNIPMTLTLPGGREIDVNLRDAKSKNGNVYVLVEGDTVGGAYGSGVFEYSKIKLARVKVPALVTTHA